MVKRMNAKKSFLFSAVVWGIMPALCVLQVVFAIINQSMVHLYVLGLDLLLYGIVLWAYLRNYFEFREDMLFTRTGPISEKYPYESITYVKKVGKTRLGISKFGALNGYINPENPDEFIEELKTHCPDLEVR